MHCREIRHFFDRRGRRELTGDRHLSQLGVHKLLMESLAGWHHWVDVFLCVHSALEEDRLVVVVFHELLHLCWQILDAFTSNSLHAHCFSQLDKVWIRHSCMCISGNDNSSAKYNKHKEKTKQCPPFLIEQVLPLEHHTLEFVVKDKNLASDAILRSSGHLHSSHRE